MSNLPETSNFDAGVYQWETTDPVLGGPSGIANTPLKNLTNRTRWLKDAITSILTTIGVLAPIDSPTFTGSPKGPTPNAAAVSTELVTAAWVRTLASGRNQIFTASGNFTVPAGVTRLRATVKGGGGPGGFSTNWASGGGGSGGTAMRVFTVTPGQVIPITIGAGGLTPTTGGGAPTPAGTTSVGSYVSATGGGAGAGGQTTNAGGPPGNGIGGDINDYGAFGGDSIPLGQRGGDGGGPGNGRGTTAYFTGLDALGYGGGGGGGGSSNVNGSGAGASGGAGKSGIAILEW